MTAINRHYREVKHLLRKTILPDSYFVFKYGFSPYQACEHGCRYCDGRAEKYYVEGEFDRDIVIRRNLPQILGPELSRLRERGIILIGSGISDPYQPVEKDEKLMAESARLIARYKMPAAVMTKSSLILRDIDIWDEVNKDSGFTLMISLTFTDDAERKVFEPNCSSVQQRIELLKVFKERGFTTGAIAMPFLPYITDRGENLERLFDELVKIGIDFVQAGSLTLRPGRQKDLYMQVLTAHRPELLEKYEQLYIENRPSGAPIWQYRQAFNKRVNALLAKYKINTQVPYYAYRDRFPVYDELFILLNHLLEYSSKIKIPQTTLKSSLNKYSQWLLTEKRIFNRKRSMTSKYLEEKLTSLIASSEVSKFFNDPRLVEIVRTVVLNRGQCPSQH